MTEKETELRATAVLRSPQFGRSRQGIEIKTERSAFVRSRYLTLPIAEAYSSKDWYDSRLGAVEYGELTTFRHIEQLLKTTANWVQATEDADKNKLISQVPAISQR